MTKEDKLVKEIEKELAGLRPTPPVKKPHVKSDNSLLIFICIFVISAAIYFVWKNKEMSVNIPSFSMPSFNQSDAKYDEVVNAINILWQKQQISSDRLTLLGAITNNNVAVNKGDYPKDDYLYLNGDWTINKMPKHIRMTEREKEYFERHLK